jgi:predicted enzyme related to lactoylglutathione lyase
MSSSVIPLYDIPYREFDEVLLFYSALGFEMVYYQKAPYRYASMKKTDLVEIGFFGNKDFSEAHPNGCFIVVEDIDSVYQELKSQLKEYYGKIPTKGKPRFSRLNRTAEDVRVNITDPCGNTLTIGQPLGDSQKLMDEEEKRVKNLSSRFEKAYAQAYRYAYSKEDFSASNNLISAALNRSQEPLTEAMIYKAKVLQLECSLALDLESKVSLLVKELKTLAIPEDSEDFTEIIARKDELLREIEEL